MFIFFQVLLTPYPTPDWVLIYFWASWIQCQPAVNRTSSIRWFSSWTPGLALGVHLKLHHEQNVVEGVLPSWPQQDWWRKQQTSSSIEWNTFPNQSCLSLKCALAAFVLFSVTKKASTPPAFIKFEDRKINFKKRPRWGKECICLGMYCYFEILRLLEHPSGFLRWPHTWFSLEVMEMMTDGPFLSLQFCRLNSPQERQIGSGESRSGLLPGLEAMVPKKTWISGFLTLSIAHPKVYYDRRFWSIQIGLDHFTLQNPQQQQQSGCWFIGN